MDEATSYLRLICYKHFVDLCIPLGGNGTSNFRNMIDQQSDMVVVQ